MLSIVLIVIAVVLVAFRKPISKLGMQSQNKAWGYKFGKKEIDSTQIVILSLP